MIECIEESILQDMKESQDPHIGVTGIKIRSQVMVPRRHRGMYKPKKQKKNLCHLALSWLEYDKSIKGEKKCRYFALH